MKYSKRSYVKAGIDETGGKELKIDEGKVQYNRRESLSKTAYFTK